MKAALLTGTRAAVPREIPDAVPAGTDEALIRIAYVGLCGSDLELYHGTSKYLRAGQTTYPHHFGHEWVGTIEEPPTGPNADHLKRGTVVTGSTMLSCHTCTTCRSGHKNLCLRVREVGLYDHAGAAAELLTMPAPALTVLDDTDSAEPRPGHVLVEPLVTVLEGIAKLCPSPGNRILVIGGGTMGSLAALVLASYPVEVVVLDPTSPAHLAHLGIKTVTGLPSTGGELYDAVWECSGAQSATEEALTCLKVGGCAVFIGVPSADTRLNVSELALNGQSILGVRHGVDHYPAAAEFIRQHPQQIDQLVDRVYPLTEVSAAFERLEQPRDRPKVVLKIG